MTVRVYYHHPDDPQYSLAYVTQDRDEITTSGQDAIIEHYDLDEEFFVLYTNQGASGTVEDLDDEFEDTLDEMSPQDRTMTVRLLQIFEEIIEETELEEEAKLEIYKQIELAQIPDALERVDWNRTAVDVAGQLMSALILEHPLPNANHRTSLSMAQWYLESIETGFSFPEFATTEYEWKEWGTSTSQSRSVFSRSGGIRRRSRYLLNGAVTSSRLGTTSTSSLQSTILISPVLRPTSTTGTHIPSSVRSFLPSPLHGLDTTN